jgi:hypothetical protein
MAAVATEHKVRWFVWAGGEKIPRTSTMRGFWGYDVECSCGWKTRTGGATKRYITNEVWYHKWSTREEA